KLAHAEYKNIQVISSSLPLETMVLELSSHEYEPILEYSGQDSYDSMQRKCWLSEDFCIVDRYHHGHPCRTIFRSKVCILPLSSRTIHCESSEEGLDLLQILPFDQGNPRQVESLLSE